MEKMGHHRFGSPILHPFMRVRKNPGSALVIVVDAGSVITLAFPLLRALSIPIAACSDPMPVNSQKGSNTCKMLSERSLGNVFLFSSSSAGYKLAMIMVASYRESPRRSVVELMLPEFNGSCIHGFLSACVLAFAVLAGVGHFCFLCSTTIRCANS